jgi:CheY-like chemotaxis protein
MASILVVDDEFGLLEVLEAVLSEAGHEVLTATNGRQGLERLEGAAVDLVLLDFMMPVMDGPAMFKALRATPALRRLPVLIMSSLPQATIAAELRGYAGFIRKPFRIREIVAAVEEALKKAG